FVRTAPSRSGQRETSRPVEDQNGVSRMILFPVWLLGAAAGLPVDGAGVCTVGAITLGVADAEDVGDATPVEGEGSGEGAGAGTPITVGVGAGGGAGAADTAGATFGAGAGVSLR